MGKYKHLFFDLDHTLWDYERNATETLAEMHKVFKLGLYEPNLAELCRKFFLNNEALWILYRNNLIKREELNVNRFKLTLPELANNEASLIELSDHFLAESPKHPHLVDGALEVLNYLKQKRYNLYIVTNGHNVMQETKLQSSGIRDFFLKVYTSEQIGAKKPQKAFFDYAIKSSNALKRESIVIGDNFEADIVGAKNFGLDQVFFNPSQQVHLEKATYEIRDIRELITILK